MFIFMFVLLAVLASAVRADDGGCSRDNTLVYSMTLAGDGKGNNDTQMNNPRGRFCFLFQSHLFYSQMLAKHAWLVGLSAVFVRALDLQCG